MQTYTELEAALREYERKHKRWIDTCVFAETAEQVKLEMAQARERYISEYRKAHPSHIVM